MQSDNNIEKELNDKINEMMPKGSLFESINYFDENQLNEFYNNMTREQAIYCLIEATKAAYRRGAFKLEESEAISKAFRVLGAS
jgi:hypothetical protein